ncbi:hypothetical protein CWI60_07075, partial [Neisseria meningitidis]
MFIRDIVIADKKKKPTPFPIPAPIRKKNLPPKTGAFPHFIPKTLFVAAEYDFSGLEGDKVCTADEDQV